jgi:hypothetical protein
MKLRKPSVNFACLDFYLSAIENIDESFHLIPWPHSLLLVEYTLLGLKSWTAC